MFIDADDFYEKDSCKILYDEIVDKDADYVIGNYIHVNQKGEKWPEPLFDEQIYDYFKLSIKDYKKSFFVMNSVVWNKIFKKEFLDKYQLRFVKGALAEDAIFSIFCYVHSQNAYYVNKVVYNYRQMANNSSISTSCTRGYFEKLDEAYKILYNIFKDSDEMGFFRYFYARITPYLLCKMIDTEQIEKDTEMIEVLKMFHWFWRLKTDYDVIILDKSLDKIIDNLIDENYEKAIEDIAITKEIRNGLNALEKEEMYSPKEELYLKMSKYDYKYI